MEEESILKKMERLFKMRRLLKEKKLKRIKDKKLKYGRWDLDDEDDDYDYEDELLSRPELIEEALKEYMYQFGLSIYQNKQGDYYFKRFADDINIRGFDELDTHHFALREKEPNFFERLLEVVPENKIHLTGDMETAVFDLYEKDAVMTDILDQMVEEETLKCREILKATEDVYETADQTRADEFSRTDALANEEFVPGLDGLAVLNAPCGQIVVIGSEIHRGRKIFTKTASLLPPAVPTVMRERRFFPPESNGRLMNAAAKSGWRKRGCLSRQKCVGCANRRPVRCRPVWLKITATTAESGFSSCRKTLPAGRVFCIPEISDQAEESFFWGGEVK